MLQNVYLLAKIGFDTTKNEPFKIWQFSAFELCKICKSPSKLDEQRTGSSLRRDVFPRRVRSEGDLQRREVEIENDSISASSAIEKENIFNF